MNNLLDKSHPPYCVWIIHQKKAAVFKYGFVLNNSSKLHRLCQGCFVTSHFCRGGWAELLVTPIPRQSTPLGNKLLLHIFGFITLFARMFSPKCCFFELICHTILPESWQIINATKLQMVQITLTLVTSSLELSFPLVVPKASSAARRPHSRHCNGCRGAGAFPGLERGSPIFIWMCLEQFWLPAYVCCEVLLSVPCLRPAGLPPARGALRRATRPSRRWGLWRKSTKPARVFAYISLWSGFSDHFKAKLILILLRYWFAFILF